MKVTFQSTIFILTLSETDDAKMLQYEKEKTINWTTCCIFFSFYKLLLLQV